MFDRETAAENAGQKLQRQINNLQSTLLEIAYIQKTEPTASALIKALKIKRDRQQQAIKATEQMIKIYSKQDPNQLTLTENAGTHETRTPAQETETKKDTNLPKGKHTPQNQR